MYREMTNIIKASALIVGISVGLSAQAALLSYSDETTWNNAVGPASGTENFDSFVTDATFKNVTVAVNNMEITGQPGLNGSTSNIIDAGSLEAGGFFSANNTPYLLGDLRGAETIRVDFDFSVSAWGAVFSGISDGVRDTKISVYDASNNLLGVLSTTAGGPDSFYGFSFDANEMADYLVFKNTSSSNDAFGMDNVSFVTGVVPEPASIALLGLGLAGIGFSRKK